MKAVLISIRPKWCAKIASRAKPLEIRKNYPALETPFKCYTYCTKPGTSDPNEILEVHDGDGNIHRCNGKVFCEFLCDSIIYLGNVATDPWKYLHGNVHEWKKRLVTESACLTEAEMLSYGGHYGWHISDLVIYDKPKELSEFRKPCPHDSDCFGCDIRNDGCIDSLNIISRPPQSWCYVEELK